MVRDSGEGGRVQVPRKLSENDDDRVPLEVEMLASQRYSQST